MTASRDEEGWVVETKEWLESLDVTVLTLRAVFHLPLRQTEGNISEYRRRSVRFATDV